MPIQNFSKQYLGLSITVKSHLMEDHSCKQQSQLEGIGDLEESFGERNHQYESIADRRHGGTRDFAMRESIKSKEQAQRTHSDVQDKVATIKDKQKRKANIDKLDLQIQAETKRQQRLDHRQAALNFVVLPDSVLLKLKDERTRLLGLEANVPN